jgi:hypothetical protein
MAEPVIAPMPPGLNLPDGYVVTWAAIDATTGDDVSGVVVSEVSIFGTALGTLHSDNAADPILIGINA